MDGKIENAQATAQALTNTSVINHNQQTGKSLENNTSVLFPSVDPWPEPVSGKLLANEIKSLMERFVYLPTGASTAITLWIMHTYAVDCFEITPRLFISSPMPGCGKSTLLDLVQMLSCRSLSVSSVTAASMFRIMSEQKPTLLIDEADTFLKNNEDLRGIINAGYALDGKVSRVETINKCQKVVFYNCYGACAIAGIGGVHKSIQERSVNIIMMRKNRTDKIERMRKRELKSKAMEIQRKCLRFAQDNEETLTYARPDMPMFLSDRGADIWEPLFAIAQTISPQWLEMVNLAAKALNKSQPSEDETSMRLQLLDDIRSIFAEYPQREQYASAWLVEQLKGLEESPWQEYGYGRGLSTHGLAKQLKFFHIAPRQIRMGGDRNRCYFAADFQDAFSRYLPQLPEISTNPENASESENNANALVLDALIAGASLASMPAQASERHNGTIEYHDMGDDLPDLPF